MKTYLYDCTTQEKRSASHRALGKELEKVPEGYEYVITIKKNKSVRSLAQNNFYHMILTIYANCAGCYLDEIKGDFYDAIGFFVYEADKHGVERKRYKSSADNNTPEMAQLISQLLQWGSVNYPEAIVPQHGDASYQQWMEVQNQYNRATAGW